eukprot:m.37557 g.37557  ORF g.37557 m.37557 type:complete len:247 (-) comp17703_c0_seq1:51-791(-)
MFFFALTLGLTSVVHAEGSTPVVNAVFCSQNLDQLVINGTAVQSIKYELCMNKPSLQYRRVDVAPSATCSGPTCTVTYLFTNGKTYQFNTNTATGKTSGCQVSQPSTPVTPSSMPFSFVIIDDEATLNKTLPTFDGLKNVSDWRHMREATHGGMSVPAEDMNWYLSVASMGSQDMIHTACIQHYGKTPGDGGHSTTSTGARDFSDSYTRDVPESTFSIPASCSSADTIVTDVEHATTLNGWGWKGI